MKKINYYFHGGSKNHGCEAIVRSTTALLGVRPVLYSDNPSEDNDYEIDKIAEVVSPRSEASTFFEKLRAKLFKNEKRDYELKGEKKTRSFDTESVALSIGGDNYCYGNTYNWELAGYNRGLHKRGVKTVLWGTSIEPSVVTEDMKKDFALYDLIVARESISYEFLKAINPNTLLTCDPAFALDTSEISDAELPGGFIPGKMVGINISPLIQKSEQVEGITYKNYRNMISYILDSTDYNIALIPHVVCEGNDDHVPLKKLYEEISCKDRVCIIEDANCEKLKGYISKCELFIGARTHATIAAYSSLVPTLVIGYSTKATGIARDLFGSEEGYVLPVQSLESPEQMKEAFIWLNDNKDKTHSILSEKIPSYKETIKKAVEEIEKL